MADVQNLERPVPVDDILPASPDTKVHGKDTTPPSVSKPVPFDEVFSQFQKDKAAKPPEKAPEDKFKEGLISDENKRLAGTQFTSQTPNKEHYVGPAVRGADLTGDERDDNIYLKDEKGNYSTADKNKHLMFRDPESGEYGIYNRDTDKNYGPITGRLVGLGNFVQEGFNAGAPTRLPSAISSATRGQEALGAARRVEEATGAHVPVPQNAVTESAISPAVTRTLEALPGGSQPFDKAAANMEGGLAGAASRATQDATTVEKAGGTAREAIEAEVAPKTGALSKRVGEAYDKVDAHVDPDATRDLSNTRAVAQDIQSRFEATKGTSGTDKIDPTINEVLSAVTDPKGITYQGLKDLRTRIGEMLEQGTKISETGVSDKQLRGLYKGLTDDMRAHVAENGGPRGLQLWERANTYARLASERRENLAKVLGTNRSDEGILGAIERMAGSTNSADAKTLATAKKSIPADEWNEIASTVASRLGKVKTDQGTHFDPEKFVKDYDKVSTRGKALLFGGQQRLRKSLDAISDLSKFTDPVSHPGQVAHLLAAGAAIHGGGEGLISKLGHVFAAVASMKVLGNMLSKPATAESVARWMQGYKLATLKPTKGNVTLFQRASEYLANDAAKEDRENIGKAGSTAVDLTKKLITLVPFPGK